MFKSILVINLWLLLLASCDTVIKKSDVKFRLNENIKPSEYVITITPYLSNGTFECEAIIHFEALINKTNTVVMHSKELENMMIMENSPTLGHIDITFDTEYEFVIFKTEHFIEPGEPLFIHVLFEGTMKDDMTGFYRSSYRENNQVKWLGTTQFQPVHARKVFPCFDEPSFKAIFTIKINCPEVYSCISNMPEKSSKNGLIEFWPTPKMSSYLVAFIVSEFIPAKKTNITEENIFRIIGRPDARNMGDYAFDFSKSIVKVMEDYTSIEYFKMDPKIKMDQVGIPDFSAGAMENWGLITYREPFVMYHPNESSVRYRQQVARLLTHEIVHMWFGNLATCHWWSDTWLNEGFANFFQHYALQKVENFGMDDQFIISQLHSALLADDATSKPLSNDEVNSPQEISSQFGTITYSKGASVIRMIENLIGLENFKNSLSSVIKTRSYNIVVPANLYTSLDENFDSVRYNGSTITEIMTSWIIQPGYPLLQVDVDHSTGRITLTQKRFLKTGENSDLIYKIPISYMTKSSHKFTNTTPSFIMTDKVMNINDPLSTDWVIFNIQQTGFYRVNYDDKSWDFIINALNSDARSDIHIYNRAQIIDDAFNLAREGHILYKKLLNITQFLEKEVDYTTWSAAFSGFSFMRMHFGKNEQISKSLDHHILELMKNVIEDLGFVVGNSENNLRRLFRMNALTFACNLEHEKCIEESKNNFNRMKTNTEYSVNPNLREHVYCNAIRHGNKSDFDLLWNKHNHENVVSEQVVIIGAMGCAKQPELINDYLMKILENSSRIRDHDRMTAFNSALNGNRGNAAVVYEFIKSNINQIRQVFGTSRLRTMLSNLSLRLNIDQLNAFETFIESSSDLQAEEKASATGSIENARKYINFVGKNQADIINWLDAKYDNSSYRCDSNKLAMFILMVLLILFNM